MSPVNIHLMLNHFPIAGMVLGVILFAIAIYRKSEDLMKAVLLIFLLLAVIAIPVYLTGEPTEEIVEHLAGVSHDYIEEHEDAAAIALASIEILGVASLAGLILFRNAQAPQWFILVIFLLSLASVLLMGWTGNLGGQIRHSEVRSGEPAIQHEEEDKD